MDVLHAPWRIQYILSPKPPASEVSLFSRIAQSNDDVANHVILRGRSCFGMLNTYPYNGGHLMVIPYRQVSDLPELTDEEMLELMKLTRQCQAALRQVMKPDGFNIGINLGRVAGGRHRGASPSSHRAAMERRHQLHAGDRLDLGRPAGAHRACCAASRGSQPLT